MDTTQTVYVKKTCSKEGCTKEAEEHMFYDSTMCRECAYDDEVSRDPKEMECKSER